MCQCFPDRFVEVTKALGVTDVTYYRWQQEYGGMSLPQAKHLKELENENERLGKLGVGTVFIEPGYKSLQFLGDSGRGPALRYGWTDQGGRAKLYI